MYHAVYLAPSGFVIVPAEDLVEPIIAFASQGRYDPSLSNPLGAMISSDVPGRVAHARNLRSAPPGAHQLRARHKWQQLNGNSDTNSAPARAMLASLSDQRVAPFVQTLWNQSTANNGMAGYNYGCAAIYVDGSLAATSTTSDVIRLSNTVPCYAAITPCSGVFPFTGVLDEIQIYNRALSGAEIQAIYAAGAKGVCPIAPLGFTAATSYSQTKGVVLNANLRSGQTYQLQASTNLSSSNWITLTKFIAGTAPGFQLTNQPATNVPQQFYRIVTP